MCVCARMCLYCVQLQTRQLSSICSIDYHRLRFQFYERYDFMVRDPAIHIGTFAFSHLVPSYGFIWCIGLSLWAPNIVCLHYIGMATSLKWLFPSFVKSSPTSSSTGLNGNVYNRSCLWDACCRRLHESGCSLGCLRICAKRRQLADDRCHWLYQELDGKKTYHRLARK